MFLRFQELKKPQCFFEEVKPVKSASMGSIGFIESHNTVKEL